MPRAVVINKAQAHKLSLAGHYTEDCELVIDAESYDEELESFDFKCKLKDEAPSEAWRGVQIAENGWAYFTCWEDGTIEPKEWE